VNTGTYGFLPYDLTVFNGKVLFNGTNASGIQGLWVTDGTAVGTHELTGISGAYPGGAFAQGFVTLDMTVFHGEVFFRGIDTSENIGLWVTDGTVAGTHELTGISGANSTGSDSYPAGLYPTGMTVLNGKLLFEGQNASGNRGLWVSDGTAVGTHELTGIIGAYSRGLFFLSNSPGFTVLNGQVLFTGEDVNGREGLWTTDGTAAGTYELSPALYPSGLTPVILSPPGTVIEAYGSTSLVQVGDNYFLYPAGGSSGPLLKYADGTTAVVAGQTGNWVLLGAERAATGYEVAWKLAGADQYTVWNTDASGSNLSSPIGVVSGSSTALQALEPSFQQDLNGDGLIGRPMIGAGETLQVTSTYSGQVVFTATTGILELLKSSGFAGTVAGMTADDIIDFDMIDPTRVQVPTYSGDSSGGTLTVTDGSHTASIALLGNYLSSTFVASSDGHGGTKVVDPALPAASSNVLALSQH
jgi:ELWxxDGT repeat protein